MEYPLSGAQGPALSARYPISVTHQAWLGKTQYQVIRASIIVVLNSVNVCKVKFRVIQMQAPNRTPAQPSTRKFLFQEPFCPPRPKLPEASVLESVFHSDLSKLWQQQNFTDIIFIAGSVGFSAHRFESLQGTLSAAFKSATNRPNTCTLFKTFKKSSSFRNSQIIMCFASLADANGNVWLEKNYQF